MQIARQDLKHGVAILPPRHGSPGADRLTVVAPNWLGICSPPRTPGADRAFGTDHGGCLPISRPPQTPAKSFSITLSEELTVAATASVRRGTA